MEGTNEATRRAMQCGWLPREEWTLPALLPTELGGAPYDVDVCPGWLVRQPAVLDGAQAYAAHNAHALDVYFPNAANPILEAAEVALQAFNQYADEQIPKGPKGMMP